MTWETPLTGAELPPAWVIGAPCGQTDPEAFFVDKGGNVDPAKAVCAGCDVIELCREWAIERPSERGVWGGMTETERSRERARRRGETGTKERSCIQCGEAFFTSSRMLRTCSDECQRARAAARSAKHDAKRRAAA